MLAMGSFSRKGDGYENKSKVASKIQDGRYILGNDVGLCT